MNQQSKNKKEKWVPSLAVTILVTLLFWPVGVYFIYKRVKSGDSIFVAKDGQKSLSGQNVKINRKVLIPTVIGLILVMVSSFVFLEIGKRQQEEDLAKYSVSFGDVANGEFVTDCNLQEGARKCSETRVEGTYSYGKEHYRPKIEGDAEITLKGDNSFVITFTSEIDQTTEEITRPVKIYFSRYDTETATSRSGFYSYDLLIRVKVTEEDRTKLNDLIAKEEAEAQRKAEEEAEKKRQEEEAEKQRQAEAERKRQEEAAKRPSSSSSSSPSSSNSSSSGSSSSSSSSTGWIKMRDGLEYKVSSAYGSHSTGIGHIKGTVKNSTKNTYTYGQLNFGIYNSSGSKVGSCMDNISNLRAGVNWEFDATCFTWPEGAKYALESFTFY